MEVATEIDSETAGFGQKTTSPCTGPSNGLVHPLPHVAFSNGRAPPHLTAQTGMPAC